MNPSFRVSLLYRYYCPTGTVTPHACTWFASCPQGSYSQTVYGFFIFMGLLDFLLAFRQGHIKIGLFGGQKDGNGGQDLISTILQGPSPEESSNQGMQLLVDAFRESFRNRELRMNFRFDNLALVLKNGKTILQGVTGEIRSKRMTAIIGPSGAGKTTFMNVLMGKVSRTGGELFINGEKTEMHLYKKIVGYVPQEDIMINHLTVRENVLHAARVRLPRHWTAKQINNHVDNILRALNLAHVANSCIGDENTRGISGGQRKRVNIAMELAAAPLAIFLDEPTSGLDATSSLDVANILHSVASLGLTIVAVIHQPRIEIFRKFDDVLMIAPGGRVAYLGPTTLAKQYFETLGFEFEPMANASDTLMDILAGKGVNRLFTLTPDQLVEIWEDRHSRDIYNEPPSGAMAGSNGRNFEREFHVVVPQVVKERGASFIKQVYYCHQRSLIQQSRQVGALALEIFVAMFAGMLMGVSTIGKVKELMNGIYWGIYILLSPAPLDLLALYGLLIGIAIALSGAPAGVKVFGEEKPVFWREAASGHSRLAYYLGKTIATVYRLILTSLHFTGLYMLLAKPVLDPYMQYALVLFQFWGVYGISCIVSVVVRRENASLLAVVIALFAAIFCGYGPSLVQAKKSGYMFLFEMSFNKWAAEANYAASILVYRNKLDIDLMASIWGYSLSQVNLDLFMCVIIGIVMRVIGFILMISLNRDKQR
ncbi:P-loop containing nucleoside triphosphate hydrolase protein [Chytriomyces cf. hyalinus JEL632]|nr:P-loop containing nucleoside triphosphate hydrolase protein [Chytriomyces cf. hyalinus JEL632]